MGDQKRPDLPNLCLVRDLRVLVCSYSDNDCISENFPQINTKAFGDNGRIIPISF